MSLESFSSQDLKRETVDLLMEKLGLLLLQRNPKGKVSSRVYEESKSAASLSPSSVLGEATKAKMV